MPTPRRTKPSKPSLKLRGILQQRSLDPPPDPPRVQLRVAGDHPLRFKKMVKVLDERAAAGDLVEVLGKDSERCGWGLYNPRSRVVLRMLCRESEAPDEIWWREKLRQAVELRENLLGLPRVTDAYRLVHAEGDGLSGLVVDKLAGVLSIEVFSLAMFQRIEAILALLGELTGCTHFLVRADDSVQSQEGFRVSPYTSPSLPEKVGITEGGLKYQVDFAAGHKTGFFCDQRDNRHRLGDWAKDRRVLDLCCYAGGFAMNAKARGAKHVTAVDLDEKMIAVARSNTKRNNMKVKFEHADAFDYLRAAAREDRRWDVVVLDPPKLIRSKAEKAKGKRKYHDLNKLAGACVEPGGLLVTCTCSGLMPAGEFEATVRAALWPRPIQVLARVGAAPDHPVEMSCPETEYLTALWLCLGDEVR